ncbi:MAG: hypothetical protein ACXV3F_06225 [Frankiaceae bacterium]
MPDRRVGPWGSTPERHRGQIRRLFGFRRFREDDEVKLAGWLADEVAAVELADERLREALRRREIWVVGAVRWRDPDVDLPADFDVHRDMHYQRLRQPLDPAEFIDTLRGEPTDALRDLDSAVVGGTPAGSARPPRRPVMDHGAEAGAAARTCQPGPA